MSCETLNIGAINLNVAVASLPEGFCPSSMQELANAIGERLIITPSSNFNSFAIGSIPPPSNVGPWLKDCLEWFVFDDATATYIPIRRGFDSIQYFNTPGAGTFIVPDSVHRIKMHLFGAGGGGSTSSGVGVAGSGGGGGAYGLSVIDVTPGQTIPYSIGTGGAVGANGGNTTMGAGTAGGGVGSPSVGQAGSGGTATGFDVNLSGGYGMSNSGQTSSDAGSGGGDAGGWGGKGGSTVNNTVAATVGREGTSPGGGGSGGAQSGNSVAGAGANGAILVEF